MPSKRQDGTRASKRRAAKRSERITYALLGGAAVVAIAVVVALAVLHQGSGSGAGSGPVAGDMGYGLATAPVTVVEYADFQCPFCREFALGPELQLRTDYVELGKVRFVFRNFAFIGQESTWAAEAAECANEQGQFEKYHDTVYQNQGAENSGALSQANLKRFAAEIGLDTAKFDACLDSGKYASVVQSELTEGEQRGIHSTPTLLVNGQVVTDGSTYTVLKAAIDAALQKP